MPSVYLIESVDYFAKSRSFKVGGEVREDFEDIIDSAEMYSTPTIRPYQAFNAQGDAQTLHEAMKGFGSNKSKIILVLCGRSNLQVGKGIFIKQKLVIFGFFRKLKLFRFFYKILNFSTF